MIPLHLYDVLLPAFMQVGKRFKPIKNIVVDLPGLYYYTLFPKDVSSSQSCSGVE